MSDFMTYEVHPNGDLMTRQAELEYECVMLGQQRFDRSEAGMDESATQPGAEQVRRALKPLAEAIDAFLKDECTPGRRKTVATRYLAHVLPEQAAYLALRHTIDGAANGAALSTTSRAVGTAIQGHLDLVGMAASAPGLYRKVLDQVKRATAARHREGVLRHVVRKYCKDRLTWSERDRVLLGAKLIELVESTSNLIETRLMTEGHHRTRSRVHFTAEAQQWFEEARASGRLYAAPIHLPMLVPPRDWVSTTEGGYLTRAIRGARMVQTHASSGRELARNAAMPAVYASVNAVQRTPWRINKGLLSVMKEAREGGPRFESLFVEADRSLSPRPADVPADVATSDLTLDQRESLTAWKRDAAVAYEFNARQKSRRVATAQKLWCAEKFLGENAIYFPHYLDFR
ncbi:MAG TPA: hypothetical protein VHX52_11010, partial [Steroidobacteraceae bacterium]|nr:hypothetical protein [Steroidobacteraceae bacterium]